MRVITKQLAKKFIERAKELNLKGAKRDNAALEFIVGASTAILIAQGEASPDTKAMTIMAYMTAMRGFAEIEKYANYIEVEEAPAA